MNPLFLTHLIADFLLQPTWLANWKQKKSAGVSMHAAVHAALLAAVLLPQDLYTGLIVALVAVSHGVIDKIKIIYQARYPNENFAKGFLFDQAAHLFVLAAATLALKKLPDFWNTEAFIGTMFLLTYFSFGMAAWNLTKHKTNHARTVRIIEILITFAVFIAAGKLCGVQLCSAL